MTAQTATPAVNDVMAEERSTESSSRFRPTSDDLVDLGFAAALSTLAVIGYRSSFGGGEELTVGVPAVLLGVVVGYLVTKLRLPVLIGAVAATAVFVAFGGAIALRPVAIGGFLPGPDVLSGLVDGTINGWVRLLTTVPPAGQAGNLLAIPYLSGYVAGLLAVVLALAFPRWPLCVLPPVLLMGLTVLLGVRDPASLLLQGALFGAVAVGWASIRVRRTAPALVAGGTRRFVPAVAMLGLVVGGAFVVGPSLPGSGAHDRYLLRERFDPPFDPSQYPSPLGRFREFHGAEPIEETLFTVDGLPDGAAIRFAVMDDYDGYVWRASPPNRVIGGNYLRVGEQIPGGVDGDDVELHFEMGAIARTDSIWLPTAGSPRSITFQGERADALTDAFRFNRITETAASPDAPRPGDRWTVVAVLPDEPDPEHLASLAAQDSAIVEPPVGLTDDIAGAINAIVEEQDVGSAGPFERLNAIAGYLRDHGGYTDGVDHPWPSGHGLVRLGDFWSGPQAVGNDEQFAAGLAYAARVLGVPSRVVLEFHPDTTGEVVEVTADDARAVVEILLDGAGWVQLDSATPPESNPPDDIAQETPKDPDNEVQPPPPTTQPPQPSVPEEKERDETEDEETAIRDDGSGLVTLILRVLRIVSIPVVLLVGPALAVLAVKARRRHRRRTKGAPDQRIAAGWRELVDLARDVGAPVPDVATRTEVARFVGADSAVALAGTTDALTFGHRDPTPDDASSVWTAVDTARVELLRPLGTIGRLRARLSLNSLRGAP